MAESNSEDPEIETPVVKARLLQETFKGRFTEEEALALLNLHDNDVLSATNYVLNHGSTENSTSLLAELNIDLSKVDFVTEEEVRQSLAQGLSVKQERRQFACRKCDNVWWRTVPVRKMVSKCFVCKKKFEALSRDNEFGWGEFKCTCENTFSGFAVMGQTSPCFKCHRHCTPVRIVPPDRKRFRPAKSNSRHVCDGPNCYRGNKIEHDEDAWNQYEPGIGHHGVYNRMPVPRKPKECIHPKSKREKKVVNASKPHVSTGSTVATFLSFTVDHNRPSRSPGLSDISSEDEGP